MADKFISMAAYTDAEGAERWAQVGDEIDLTASERKRLSAAGALFDQKAHEAALKAEEDARQQQLADEEAARETERERIAGEQAAQAQAEKATSQSRAAQQASKSSG